MKKRILILLLLCTMVLSACRPQEANGDLRILFINVGKADAACIALGERYYMIDTGSKDSVGSMLDALSKLGVKKERGIEGVFLTHSHSDHMGGLKKLSEAYPIACVYRSVFGEQNKEGVNKIQKQTAKLSLKSRSLHAGNIVRLSKDVYFEVLGPLEYNEKDDNDNSLVLLLHAYGRKVLFTGDMQFAEEESLLQAGKISEADVLKVGNHGNPDATGEDLAALVSPAFALISTDRKEDADSANKRVLEALSGAEIQITDETERGVFLRIGEDGEISWEKR